MDCPEGSAAYRGECIELTQPYDQVAAGGEHACARWLDGGVRCAGGEDPALIGDFEGDYVTAGWRHTCVMLEDRVDCWGVEGVGPEPDDLGWVVPSAGQDFTCALRDGVLGCWGPEAPEVDQDEDLQLIALSAGDHHVCALDLSGQAHCFGQDDHGQSTPPELALKALAAGGVHTCGLDFEGQLHCWGVEDGGAADFGQVSELPELDEGEAITQISSGRRHSCLVTEEGSVHCWGSDALGQSTAAEAPWVRVSAGDKLSCGLTALGEAACWGFLEEVL